MQTSILLMTIANRIGSFQQHKQQSQKQLFSCVGRCRNPPLPVADNLLGEGKFGGGLRPALLLVSERGTLPKVVLQQTIL